MTIEPGIGRGFRRSMRLMLMVVAASSVWLVGASPPLGAHDGPGHTHSAGTTAAGAPTDARDATIQFLRERLQTRPDDTIALSKLAATLLSQARTRGVHEVYAEAAEAFGDLCRLDPASANARIGLAYAHIGQHHFHEALESAREADGLGAGRAEIWALLADVHMALGNYTEAELAAERLLAEGMTLRSLARIALLHDVRGRWSEARNAFDQADEAGRLLGDDPAQLAWVRTMLGDLHRKRGQLDEARRAYRQALTLDPAAHAASFGLAETARRSGDLADAELWLRDLAQSHDIPRYWIALGDVLVAQGRAAEGAAWLQRAEDDMRADLLRGDLAHARELVTFWLDHDRELPAALALATREVEEVRRDHDAWALLGWALFRNGRVKEAVGPMRRALRIGAADDQLAERASIVFRAAAPRIERLPAGFTRSSETPVTSSRQP